MVVVCSTRDSIPKEKEWVLSMKKETFFGNKYGCNLWFSYSGVNVASVFMKI